MFDPHTPSMILSVFPTDNKDQAHLLLALALMRSSPNVVCLPFSPGPPISVTHAPLSRHRELGSPDRTL